MFFCRPGGSDDIDCSSFDLIAMESHGGVGSSDQLQLSLDRVGSR
jgi:hypothetical protein